MDKRGEWSLLKYFESMVLEILGVYLAISLLQVNHPQRMSEKLLTPWVVAKPTGKTLCAYCDCKAGLGECCSHVASLLWAVEVGLHIQGSMMVTQKKAYRVMPHSMKDVSYDSVKQIEFLGKKRSLTSFQTVQF